MLKKIFITAIIILSGVFIYYKYNSASEYKEDHSEAYAALQFLGAANAFPGIDIPPDAYGRAWNYYQTNYANSMQRMPGSLAWTSIGPANIGGRTISIAIDPADTSVVWMGSASGGLWKSTTGGVGFNTWQYVPTGFPILGVGAIAINPNNHNEMMIGTGETYDYGKTVNGLVIRTTRGSNGIGILKSSDGGITWSHSLDWSYNQNRGVWDIIYDYTNPSIIYAATTEGIFKTVDGGNVWDSVFNEKMVMDLAIDPLNPLMLYAGVGNLTSLNKGLYKTTDGGANWAKLANGIPAGNNTGRTSIDIYKSNPNVVMAMITNSESPRGLYRSEDRGVTWTLQSNDDLASYQGWYSKCLKIHETDSSKVFVGGVEVFKSDFGGLNPYQITNTPSGVPWSDMHDLIVNPLDPNKYYLLTDAGLFRSNNACVTWFNCNSGYNANQFYHGSLSLSDSTVGLGGLQDHNTVRFNGTNVWLPVFGGDGCFNAIDPVDDYVQYAAYQYLNVAKSYDRGFSFSNIVLGGGISPGFVAPFTIAPSNRDRLYAGDRGINVSSDQGMTWTPSTTIAAGNAVLSIDVSYSNPDKLYFATIPNGAYPTKVFLSTDAAATWTSVSTGLPNRYPRDIAVDPADDNTLYVAFSGFGAGHIYKSTNSGTSWTDVSATLPDIPFHTVLVADYNSNIIFAGSDYGVFASTDAGSTWTAYNAGLPLAVMVFDLQYSPSDHSLVAFTHGNGAYKSSLAYLTVSMNERKETRNLLLYPTLATENINLQFHSIINKKIDLHIFDMNGRQIKSQNNTVQKGMNEIQVDVNNLSNGSYIVTFNDGNHTYSKKFIKGG